MAKTKIDVRNTENALVKTLPAGSAVDTTTTSINLFSKGIENYLKQVNENFYKTLENFAAKKSPNKPLQGQLWYSKKGSKIVSAMGTGANGLGDNKKYPAKTKVQASEVSSSTASGIWLTIIDNSKLGSTPKPVNYDIAGSDNAKTSLATQLGKIKPEEMFIMVSYDTIDTNKDLNSRMNALGSQAWHKIKEKGKYPYAAIGTGKFGIISEDLQMPDSKKHAYAQVSFESLKPEEGMGPHAALFSTATSTEKNDNLLMWKDDKWTSSSLTVDGRDLKTLRSFILSGIDLSVKFDRAGGTVNGSVVFKNTLMPKVDITPTGNEIQDLGTSTKRYRNIHLSENNSIYMGEGKSFDKNSFVYTVEKETDSVTYVPAGSLILNRATGEAIVKKSNCVESLNNNTFRKLSTDRKYGFTIGGNNFNFNGDRGVWMGSWNHGVIQYVSIPTTANSLNFGSCRSGGHSAGASDGVRGLSFYQHGSTDSIQYVTIATPMNALDFGVYGSGHSSAAASDGTTAVTFGGANRPYESYYVLFSTPMNAVKFGDLNTTAHWCAAVSEGSKGVFDRGSQAWNNNEYRYVSISTPSSSIYFGKMQNTRGWTGAASNGVHGLWAGGHNGNIGNVSTIEKLTLATPGNSSHFGNLTYSRHTADPVANDSRMVAAGGATYSTILDYVSFANGGAASKFGDAGTGIRFSAYFSGN